MMKNDRPLLPHRGGHLLLAALTGFMGSYNLWIAANGLHDGAIWIFTKKAAAQVGRSAEPGWFWATVAGRLGFGLMLSSVAVACLRKARSRAGG
jgi:hypothetical protein